MGGAEGSDRPARRTGRRNHAWVIDKPGHSHCTRCGLLRKFVKRGATRWKVYYRQVKDKQFRPLGPKRKVPACVRADAESPAPPRSD